MMIGCTRIALDSPYHELTYKACCESKYIKM